MNLPIPDLSGDKSSCCGCGVCKVACPTGAIFMIEDKYGFCFPGIDPEACVRCGRCIEVCGFKRDKPQTTLGATYATARKHDDVVFSASGGVFAALAESVLESDGIVYGCFWHNANDTLEASFGRVANGDDLRRCLGSKYVQSDLSSSLDAIKEDLRGGKEVLVCALPCQIAALKRFLGKSYVNLITIDLICHGVPGVRFFNEELQSRLPERGARAVAVSFRSKTNGWGPRGFSMQVEWELPSGKEIHSEPILPDDSPFFFFFEGAQSIRGSCLSCPFASENRPGDITIGDFWGVEELLSSVVGAEQILEVDRGISVLVCNTGAGEAVLMHHGRDLVLVPTSYELAARGNGNLRYPTKPSRFRKLFLWLYGRGGYRGAVAVWRFCRSERDFMRMAKKPIKKLLRR